MTFPLSTFFTMDLEILAKQVFDAGWNYVAGALYTRDGIAGELVMQDGYYSMEAAAPSFDDEYAVRCAEAEAEAEDAALLAELEGDAMTQADPDFNDAPISRAG